MLDALDYLVIAFNLAVVTGAGFWFGRKQKSTEDFFLGGRRMPWGAVMLSILAAEISALTFVGVPADSFATNFVFFQIMLGSLIGRILIAVFFLPAFYSRRVTTVYEYLKQRFGDRTRDAGILFFLVVRLLGTGVRLGITAKALEVLSGLSYFQSVCAVAVAAVAYTTFGGIKGVIWADVVQFVILVGGVGLALYLIIDKIPGGVHGAHTILRDAVDATGQPAHKLRVFDFTFSLTKKSIFFAAILNGCFQTFAALGADQASTQRMLTCKDVGRSKKSLILTGVLDLPIYAIFLLVGAGLYVFNVHTGLADGIKHNDHVFPTFIGQFLPAGIRGLLFSAILAAAMSSFDSILNALSTSTVMDIYKPYIRRDAPDRHYLTASRICVPFFALILIGIAYALRNEDRVLWLAFELTGYPYGALLGVFLAGILTRRGNNLGNILAMFSSVGLLLAIRYKIYPDLNWQFFVIIGTLWTFGVAILFKPRRATQPASASPTSPDHVIAEGR